MSFVSIAPETPVELMKMARYRCLHASRTSLQFKPLLELSHHMMTSKLIRKAHFSSHVETSSKPLHRLHLSFSWKPQNTSYQHHGSNPLQNPKRALITKFLPSERHPQIGFFEFIVTFFLSSELILDSIHAVVVVAFSNGGQHCARKFVCCRSIF